MTDSNFGYPIELGTKEYPGPLLRRRVDKSEPPLDPAIAVYEDGVYETGVYVEEP